MNPHDQQWLTVWAASEAGLVVDDVWVRYVALGGAADAVAVAAYLHGMILLDVLHRDLVSYAVNDLLNSPATRAWLPPSPGGGDDSLPEISHWAPYRDDVPVRDDQDTHRPGTGRTSSDPLGWRDETWPRLTTHLKSMFDPLEAENRRVASLGATGLVGAGQEERFDRFTRLARHDFMTHAAVISFIEADHQVIKSIAGPRGTGPTGAGSRGANVPREESFCVHTIEDDRTLIIKDTTRDERVADNPSVTGGSHIRFYAGHPLTGPGGWRIGALCIVDTEPRPFTQDDQRRLRTLAVHVQAEILNTNHP